jgi:succinyl-diaminopimelate desuccinylase
MALDPIELAQALIRRPSVTPKDAGAMDVVEKALASLGFACRRMKFGEIENLYARRGVTAPNLCFAGHTDVVPAGDEAAWTHGPFEARIEDGVLFGRGAADMKGAVAAFIAAVSQVLAAGEPPGSLSFLITGDEEGEAIDGTRRVVEALKKEGERVDACVVGEPSSAKMLGDMVKVGRRGSLNAWITVEGRQGHAAYPDRAANPIPPLVALLSRLEAHQLDDGFPGFQPSNLEITTVDVGNPATNVIPAKASARLNIRFNPVHSSASLSAWLEVERAAVAKTFPGGSVDMKIVSSGEAFITEPGPFVALVSQAVEAACGQAPELSTTGGASDARFIRALCPVVELGLVGASMHGVDEHAPAADIVALTALYRSLIERYFKTFA